MSNQPRRRGPMGGGHGRMGTGEKAKDFKGTMKKLFTYLSEYKIGIFFVRDQRMFLLYPGIYHDRRITEADLSHAKRNF